MSGFAVVGIDFTNQETTRVFEAANAWGGMPLIWDLFAICYGKDPRTHSYSEIVDSLGYQIEIDEKAPQSFASILKLTDELAFVERADFDRLLSDLREFFNNMPPREDEEKYVSHWPEIVKAIELVKADCFEAVGFYSTVAGDVWRIDYEDEKFVLKKEDFRNVYGPDWPDIK